MNETFFVFKDLINFIDRVCKNKNKFNKQKAQNSLESTSFSKLRKLEKNSGFSESITSKKKKIYPPVWLPGRSHSHRNQPARLPGPGRDGSRRERGR